MTTLETELVGYKKRVEQMTVLLKHYQNELENQKLRRDGVETVSRLLADVRQENIFLKKKQTAQETLVKNLQNLLVVNGLSYTSEMGNNEVIIPGTSKQTLINLVLENKRLRSLLQDTTSESIDSLQKPCQLSDVENMESEQRHQQQSLKKLEAENKSMKTKLSELESLLKSSASDKDRQLMAYRTEIEELQSRLASEEKVPSGEEKAGSTTVAALKEQLKSLVALCQSFDLQLDNVPVKESSATETVPQHRQASEETETGDGVDVQQLLEEKQQLQARMEDVTKMNQRWQEFYSERERYTAQLEGKVRGLEEYGQQLEAKVQGLEQRLQESLHTGPTHEFNLRLQQLMDKNNKEAEHLEDLRRKAEEEAEDLLRQLAVKDSQLLQLQSQVEILSRAAPHQSPSDVSGTIEHLKAQIQVCTEDFEKERQDRQLALQKLNSLQEHNAHLQKQCANLQKMNGTLQTLVHNQMGQPGRPTAQEHSQGPNQGPNSLQPRGIRYPANHLDYDGPKSSGGSLAELNYVSGPYDCGPTSSPPYMSGTHVELIPRAATSNHRSTSVPQARDNVLTCPKCNTEFSETDQAELLAHMDVCTE